MMYRPVRPQDTARPDAAHAKRRIQPGRHRASGRGELLAGGVGRDFAGETVQGDGDRFLLEPAAAEDMGDKAAERAGV